MDILTISYHFLFALIVGGVIGMERSRNGHAAGFRTYSLVCLASTMLMEAANAPGWHGAMANVHVFEGQTRIVQGILAGVGFIGAGVIVKDGHAIRGLTTAASIWVTATLGVLIGSGFYVAAVIGSVFTLITLTIFRAVENKVQRRRYARCSVKFSRTERMEEQALKDVLSKAGFVVEDVAYDIGGAGEFFEYHLTIWSRDFQGSARAVQALAVLPSVIGMHFVPSRD